MAADRDRVGGDDRAGVIDLLGALALGELVAFDQLAQDARQAPTLAGQAALAGMAAVEIGHYGRLVERLRSMGVDESDAMAPFVEPLRRFHERTTPSTWLEGLIKAYVGDGLAADFYREIAQFVDGPTRELITTVLEDAGSSQFAIREVEAATTRDPALRGRLALWARRLVGEAIAQTQAVLAEHDALTELFLRGAGDLAGAAALIARITDKHQERMAALNLSA